MRKTIFLAGKQKSKQLLSLMNSVLEKIFTMPLKYRIGILLTGFLAIGILIVGDYGISWDEPIQHNHTMISLTKIYQTLHISLPGGFYQTYGDLPDLDDYMHRHYGVAFQFLPALGEIATSFLLQSPIVYYLRHLFTFLLFFAAVVSFYFLARRMWPNSKWLPLLTVVFLILSPRIFADSFYNIKDLVFLSLFVMTYACADWYWRVPDLWRAVLFAIALAVAINSRFIAIVVLPMLVLAGLYQCIVNKKITFWQWCVHTLLIVIILELVYVLITPAAWNAPFTHFIDVVSRFQNYERWHGNLWYFGQTVNVTSGSAIPWHYLPVWIVITTPVLYIVLFVSGCFGYLIALIKDLRKTIISDITPIIMMVCAVISAVLIKKPIFYNGWRHFYFIYPFIILISIYGLQVLLDCLQTHLSINYKRVYKKIIIVGLCAYLSCLTFWMVRNHPYQYVFFAVPYRNLVRNSFDLDYWVVSFADQLKYLHSLLPASGTSIYSDQLEPLRDAMLLFNDYENTRIDISRNPDYYLLSSYYRKDPARSLPYFHLLHAIDVDNMRLSSLYEYDFVGTQMTELSYVAKKSDIVPDTSEDLFDLQQQVESKDVVDGTFVVNRPAWLTIDFGREVHEQLLLRLNEQVTKPDKVAVGTVIDNEEHVEWHEVDGDWSNHHDFLVKETGYRYLSLLLDSEDSFNKLWNRHGENFVDSYVAFSPQKNEKQYYGNVYDRYVLSSELSSVDDSFLPALMSRAAILDATSSSLARTDYIHRKENVSGSLVDYDGLLVTGPSACDRQNDSCNLSDDITYEVMTNGTKLVFALDKPLLENSVLKIHTLGTEDDYLQVYYSFDNDFYGAPSQIIKRGRDGSFSFKVPSHFGQIINYLRFGVGKPGEVVTIANVQVESFAALLDKNELVYEKIENVDFAERTGYDAITYRPFGSRDSHLILMAEQPLTGSFLLRFNVEGAANKQVVIRFSDKIDYFSEKMQTKITVPDNGEVQLPMTLPAGKDVTFVRLDIDNEADTLKVNNWSITKIHNDSDDADQGMELDYFSSHKIIGHIHVDSFKFLVFPIKDKNGWRIYDNGKLVEKVPANFDNCGIYLTAGDHDIELRYVDLMPFIITGIVVLITLLGGIYCYERNCYNGKKSCNKI